MHIHLNLNCIKSQTFFFSFFYSAPLTKIARLGLYSLTVSLLYGLTFSPLSVAPSLRLLGHYSRLATTSHPSCHSDQSVTHPLHQSSRRESLSYIQDKNLLRSPCLSIDMEKENKNEIMERKKKQKKKQKQKQNNNEENQNSLYKNQKNALNEEKKEEEKKSEERTTKQEVTPNERKRKVVFPYGNYRNYYGYRISEEVDGDPRLKVFKRDWFQGKDCLDIGCNSGIITIQIAKEFRCKSILGIDIDSDRVSDAYWHLRKFVRTENAGKNSSKAAGLEFTDKVNDAEHSAAVSAVKKKEDGSPSEEVDLFDVVSFRQENFVQSQRPSEKQYDTILCLSVSKWIHLNWGDDGLISLFSKIWRLLHPGGILVLEPQPWQSYEKNRRVSETTAMNYRTIMFRPESFREILLDKIGFRRVEDITTGLSGSKTGFDRPIFVYRK